MRKFTFNALIQQQRPLHTAEKHRPTMFHTPTVKGPFTGRSNIPISRFQKVSILYLPCQRRQKRITVVKPTDLAALVHSSICLCDWSCSVDQSVCLWGSSFALESRNTWTDGRYQVHYLPATWSIKAINTPLWSNFAVRSKSIKKT